MNIIVGITFFPLVFVYLYVCPSICFISDWWLEYLYPWHMKYAEGVYSFRRFSSSIHSSVSPFFSCPWFCLLTPAITKFYFEVFLLHISLQPHLKLFIFSMGVPGRVPFHSTSMDPWVMPRDRAKGQKLERLSKVVYCSLFIQTTSL